MLKTIADEYHLGSIDAFSKLKVYFVQAAGTHMYLWSMRYEKNGSLYESWLENDLRIDPDFGKSVEYMPKMICFYWMMKCLVQETVSTIEVLKDEHKNNLKTH
ncbi:hypothetical protein K501DRAFT_289308 [Backusella circina FSU 941]|nr:hypothetical protein K501DRAFT_289308 [Backusella circina FSU 941]